MFHGFMVNAWTVATIVAVVAGIVGFFAVLRGSAFAAHAIPNGSFAGAAGAALIGVNTLIGLGAFSLLGALGISALGRRGRQDVATALTLTLMLGLGALFLSLSNEYAPQVYSLLFGEVLGISSVAMQLCFLLAIALVTTMTVPVVGTLLIFSLMIGPPAAARSFTDRPGLAMALSVAFALIAVWGAIACSYATNYPVGFFVGSITAASFVVGRAWAAFTRR